MRFKNLFPIMKKNPELIYLDSAATTLKPQTVIQAEVDYLINNGANPHTTAYQNAFLANNMVVEARSLISDFIGATDKNEIVFTSGATASLNQIAFGLQNFLSAGDEIWISNLEHASNSAPWIAVAHARKAIVKTIPLDNNFQIDVAQLVQKINHKTKIISFAHATNTIGVVNNVQKITQALRKKNKDLIIVLDCAQSVGHYPIDVRVWDVNFIAFSTHKMYGPFSLGVLWGQRKFLEQLVPLIYGGGMVTGISKNLQEIDLNTLPMRLEAGTQNIPAIAALKATINFIGELGLPNIAEHEKNLKQYARQQIIVNNLQEKITFFNLENDAPIILLKSNIWHSQDVVDFLDKRYHLALRNGAHCAWLTTQAFSDYDTIRVSFGVYNDEKDIDVLIEGLKNLDHSLDILFGEK